MTLSITTLEELRQTVAGWRQMGESVAFVPTMGALHAGHMALVREAKNHTRRVVVSIFVNPTQFGPKEDFSRYPRPLEKDIALLQAAGVDAAWLPSVETMYPNGAQATIHIEEISDILEGAFRPGHFDGVATVVAALFSQVMPDIAIFGEKDYQQLCLIKRLVKKLKLNINILGMPTIRESSGLALSSRNQYLSPKERVVAPVLYQTLLHASRRIESGDEVSKVLHDATQNLLNSGFHAVDYIALAAADSLRPLTHYTPPARLLAAAHLGTTRLIDNVSV